MRSSEADSRLRRGAPPGLAEATRWIVETAVARERRLLELDRDFYRRFNRQFVLGYRVAGPERLRTARVWAVGAAPEEVPRTAHRRRVTFGQIRFAR